MKSLPHHVGFLLREAFGWWNRTAIRGAPAEFGPDGRYNQWEVGAAVVLGRG
jgi:hypothetical protein